MDKIRPVLRHESPERLRRLAKAYLRAALMKDHDDGEKERLFFRAADRIRALTEPHPIKPTSPRCQSAWQPNPGRRSTIDAENLFR